MFDRSHVILAALVTATIVFFFVLQKYSPAHVHTSNCCHGHVKLQ